MRVTASSPDPIRARAVAVIRREFAPGEARAMALRAVGIIPTPEDLGNSAPPPHGAESHPCRRERRAAETAWPNFAATVRSIIATRNEDLRIWIPGLILLSENSALGGERKGSKRGFVQVRHAAKQECQLALMRALDCKAGMLHRFTARVRIEVLQIAPRLRIDPGNLYKKPLIDCLTERGGGLGVIRDDRREFVAFEGTGYMDEYHGDDTPGVLVRIEVASEPHQSPRRASLPPGSPANGSLRSSHRDADPVATAPGAVKEARREAR